MGTDADLLAHWMLAGDCRDHSGNDRHGRNRGADLAADGACFDGRGAHVLVPPSAGLNLGTGDFTIAVEIHTDDVLDDVPGDIVSRYARDTRTGFQFSLLSSAGVTAAQANYRHLHFGIDAGSEGAWIDCGRPGNNLRVYSLCVFRGDLYAGTFETGADEAGGVYRYDGKDGWEPCGSPDAANTVASLCVYDGDLYAGTSRYRAGGSALPESENRIPGGAMYRYAGGGEWLSAGRLEGADSCAGMAVYRGELYAIPLYSQGVFRYQGGDRWAHCGTPGRRLMALGVFNGHLYGAGNEGGERGGVFRYAGGSDWVHAGGQEGVSQVYSFAAHNGRWHVGTWPEGKVFRDDGDDPWTCVGRLGQELEVMAMTVYNGKLYAGTLPLGQVYRYDGGQTWTLTGQLDTTPGVRYRRVWSMAVYRGRLFAGTLPSGRVYALEAGANVTCDHELEPGWRRLAAVRKGGRLALYVDGVRAATSAAFDASAFDLSTDQPLRIGAGAIDTFNGRIRDLRLYGRALAEDEIARLRTTTRSSG